MSTKYNHPEAFCLMRYQDEKTNEIEVLWNSRDGVTPFCIQSRDGKTMMRHVEWQSDFCWQEFKPWPGMRIFVDLTPAKAEEYAARRVENNWNRGMSRCYKSKAAAIKKLSGNRQDGEPDVFTIV